LNPSLNSLKAASACNAPTAKRPPYFSATNSFTDISPIHLTGASRLSSIRGRRRRRKPVIDRLLVHRQRDDDVATRTRRTDRHACYFPRSASTARPPTGHYRRKTRLAIGSQRIGQGQAAPRRPFMSPGARRSDRTISYLKQNEQLSVRRIRSSDVCRLMGIKFRRPGKDLAVRARGSRGLATRRAPGGLEIEITRSA